MTVITIDSAKPDLPPKPKVVFEVKRRLKLWVMTRDDVYCGSFPDEKAAQDAAQKQVQAIIKSGAKAELLHADSYPHQV
jgi:hypothetical protein